MQQHSGDQNDLKDIQLKQKEDLTCKVFPETQMKDLNPNHSKILNNQQVIEILKETANSSSDENCMTDENG